MDYHYVVCWGERLWLCVSMLTSFCATSSKLVSISRLTSSACFFTAGRILRVYLQGTLQYNTIQYNTDNARITQQWGAFANHCCRGIAINVTYLSVCVCARVHACTCSPVALCIQHATVLAPPSSPYSSTLSHKRHYFREKVIEHKMCFGFL